MGELSRTYYARIKPVRRMGRHEKVWTRDRALYALHLWMAESGRAPTEPMLRNEQGLPGTSTLYKLFASLQDYIEACREAERNNTLNPDFPDIDQAILQASLACERAVKKPTDDGGAPAIPVRRPCLRCGQTWDSPDKVYRWICDPCTVAEYEDESADWMNGPRPFERGRSAGAMYGSRLTAFATTLMCTDAIDDLEERDLLPEVQGAKHTPERQRAAAKARWGDKAWILSERKKLAAMSAEERRTYWREKKRGRHEMVMLQRYTNRCAISKAVNHD